MHRIHIIESPHADDLFEDRYEGRALTSALRLAEANVSYRLAATPETFQRALSLVGSEFNDQTDPRAPFPFIHISAHGDSKGLRLTDGQRFDWEDLQESLEDINEKIGLIDIGTPEAPVLVSRLSLCLSSCEGYSAYQMQDSQSCMFAFLVGPLEKIAWIDSLTAYQVFYRALLSEDTSIPFLVNRMNAAIGFDGGFQSHVSPNFGLAGKNES